MKKPLQKEDVIETGYSVDTENCIVNRTFTIEKSKLTSAYNYAMTEIDTVEKEIKKMSFGYFDEKPFIVFRGILKKAFGEAVGD